MVLYQIDHPGLLAYLLAHRFTVATDEQADILIGINNSWVQSNSLLSLKEAFVNSGIFSNCFVVDHADDFRSDTVEDIEASILRVYNGMLAEQDLVVSEYENVYILKDTSAPFIIYLSLNGLRYSDIYGFPSVTSVEGFFSCYATDNPLWRSPAHLECSKKHHSCDPFSNLNTPYFHPLIDASGMGERSFYSFDMAAAISSVSDMQLNQACSLFGLSNEKMTLGETFLLSMHGERSDYVFTSISTRQYLLLQQLYLVAQYCLDYYGSGYKHKVIKLHPRTKEAESIKQFYFPHYDAIDALIPMQFLTRILEQKIGRTMSIVTTAFDEVKLSEDHIHLNIEIYHDYIWFDALAYVMHVLALMDITEVNIRGFNSEVIESFVIKALNSRISICNDSKNVSFAQPGAYFIKDIANWDDSDVWLLEKADYDSVVFVADDKFPDIVQKSKTLLLNTYTIKFGVTAIRDKGVIRHLDENDKIFLVCKNRQTVAAILAIDYRRELPAVGVCVSVEACSETAMAEQRRNVELLIGVGLLPKTRDSVMKIHSVSPERIEGYCDHFTVSFGIRGWMRSLDFPDEPVSVCFLSKDNKLLAESKADLYRKDLEEKLKTRNGCVMFHIPYIRGIARIAACSRNACKIIDIRHLLKDNDDDNGESDVGGLTEFERLQAEVLKLGGKIEVLEARQGEGLDEFKQSLTASSDIEGGIPQLKESVARIDRQIGDELAGLRKAAAQNHEAFAAQEKALQKQSNELALLSEALSRRDEMIDEFKGDIIEKHNKILELEHEIQRHQAVIMEYARAVSKLIAD